MNLALLKIQIDELIEANPDNALKEVVMFDYENRNALFLDDTIGLQEWKLIQDTDEYNHDELCYTSEELALSALQRKSRDENYTLSDIILLPIE